MTAQLKQLARVLRDGKRVRDAVFDQVYPPYIRRASETYWTPVHVALTAARWLAETDCKKLLDVGCGPGKFCVVVSLALQRRVTGVEQRKDVVDAAQRAAAAYGANVKLVHGTVEDIEPRRFDAFYLFNPFGENLYDPDDQLDDSVELSPQRSRRDLALVERWLEAAPVGTIALTYHGFGGRIPSTYKLMRSAKQGPIGCDCGRSKQRASRRGSFSRSTTSCCRASSSRHWQCVWEQPSATRCASCSSGRWAELSVVAREGEPAKAPKHRQKNLRIVISVGVLFGASFPPHGQQCGAGALRGRRVALGSQRASQCSVLSCARSCSRSAASGMSASVSSIAASA